MSGVSRKRQRSNLRRRVWSNSTRLGLESLERRTLLTSLTLSGGTLSYAASFGEANILTVDLVRVGTTAYVRFHESRAGLTITPSGAGLIADAPNTVRAPATGLASISILMQPANDPENPTDPDLVNDIVTVVLDNAMPALMSLDSGPSTADQLTIRGTSGDDTFTVVPSWSAEGARILQVTHAATTFTFGDSESVTFDMSGAGQDVVALDRYVAGIDRPTAFHLIGGGAGNDSLSIVDTGNVPQTVDLADGSVSMRDTPPTSELFLGRSDNVAIDQPKVAVEVIDTDANGDPVSLGPQAFNTLLLDTGASGIMFGASPASELLDAGLQIYSEGYDEQGVAGFSTVSVSLPYRFDFAGDSGVRNTLDDVQMELMDSDFSFFGPWGLVGEPALQGRVTDIDMSKWLNPLDQETLSIGTDFLPNVPASSGHFYHVPLQFVDFPASGQHPGGPIPTFASLPELPVKVRENGKEVAGNFLLDTGAQLSVLSSAVAFAIGLDRNNNGTLNDEAVDFIDVGGVGGTTAMPLLPVDRLSVPTDEGAELVWSKLLVGVEDIEVPDGPPIAGVFGMDFLTSGWATKILSLLLGTATGDEPNGYFVHNYLDFHDTPSTQTGTLVLDVVPEHDLPGAPVPNTLSIDYTGLDAVSVTTGAGDDVVNVAPSTTVLYTLTGGAHSAGDTLHVDLPPINSATNDGNKIHIPGFLDITHAQFEFFNIAGNASTSSISGQVFNDMNANGVKDAGEGGLSSVVVYVDANGNGRRDSGETSATSDANGNYTLVGVPTGTQVVRQAPKAGVSQTAPTPTGYFTVSVTSGATVTGQNFGDVASASLSAGTLSVYGSLFGDTIQLALVGTDIVVTTNGSSLSFPYAAVTTIRVWGLGGDDDVEIGTGIKGATLDGGIGNDSLNGGDGNDSLIGGPGNDLLAGGAGNDVYQFQAATSNEVDTIVELAAQGTDRLDFGALAAVTPVSIDLTNDAALATHAHRIVKTGAAGQAANIENATGGSGDDTITGNNGNNTLEGGPGNDVIAGGPGNDVYTFRAAALAEVDTVIEQPGEGIDRLDFSTLSATTPVTVDLGSDTALATHVNRTVKTGAAGQAANFENATGGAGNDTITGQAAANALAGGAGNDTITGGLGNDTITGGAGNDLLAGGDDQDTYSFDADVPLGSDVLVEAPAKGIDTIDFTPTTTLAVVVNLASVAAQAVNANLTLTLSAGDVFENAIGGAQSDTITGNALANSLVGGAGDDSIAGSGGDDILVGGIGNDSLSGGGGDDLYPFTANSPLGSDTLVELANGGTDTIDFSSTTQAVAINLSLTSAQAINANLTLTLSAGNVFENATGGRQNDTLIGNALANLLTGGLGNDSLTGGAGDDLLVGGVGNDTYLFNAGTALGSDRLVELAAGGTDWLDFSGTVGMGVAVDLSMATLQTVNPNLALTLSAGDVFENVIGSNQGDTLRGNAGVNSLVGGAGNDVLRGAAGNDVLIGGPDDDTYSFDADTPLGTDTLNESGGGIDTLDFSATTGVGISIKLGVATTQVVNPNLSLVLGSTSTFENVVGSALADTITGNSLSNTLAGGPGDDRYVFDADSPLGDDTIVENLAGGTDLLDFATTTTIAVAVDLSKTATQVVNANLTLTLSSGQTIENLTGGSMNDTLVGNTLANAIVGGPGNDLISGGDGNDVLTGGTGNDIYTFAADAPLGSDTVVELGGAGVDTLDFSATLAVALVLDLSLSTAQVVNANLTLSLSAGDTFENAIGGAKDDTLTGNNLANSLIGGAGNDSVTGAGGNDSLDGGAGNDSLAGGAGNDVYQFLAASAAELDTVVELAGQGLDRLDFSALDATTPVKINLGSDTQLATHANRTVRTAAVGQAANIENATGGAGDDLIVGNASANSLVGGAGRDILIGGRGADSLSGGSGDDLLIGGQTAYDTNFVALDAILAEWISADLYPTRRSKIMAGAISGGIHLDATTIINDSAIDSLTGATELDWFLVNSNDNVTDQDPATEFKDVF